MSILKVPHIKQIGRTHCGVACLEMIYRYFGITNLGQDGIWEQRKTLRPDGTNFYMKTENMIKDLIDSRFVALHSRIALENEKCSESLKVLFNKDLPIIACKQWSQNPNYGHFVVVIGTNDNNVIYLDPELGPEPQEKFFSDFINEWKRTNNGEEVVGGEFIAVGSNEKDIQRIVVSLKNQEA